MRFVDYLDAEKQGIDGEKRGNNVVLGITETQHAGSMTMFNATDPNNPPRGKLYVSNDYDQLRNAIINWDSFGNCEHVHYDTNQLEIACANLENNLKHWDVVLGQKIGYDDIQKVALIIGGPTENSSGDNGYGCTLPWGTFQTTKLDSVYGIRTNIGTPYSSGLLSWLDNSGNMTGTPYENANGGTTFTKKYVATTEDAIFNALVNLARIERLKKGIVVKEANKYVEDVTVTDVVSPEFQLDYSEPIRAIFYDKDGNIDETREIPQNDSNLKIEVKEDGTTKITYNFGTVYNTKKVELKFRVQAKENFIGSNNVFTNVGTPELEWKHSNRDSGGQLTGVVKEYKITTEDTPEVNVPIRFTTVNGESRDIKVGDSVNLKDLSNEIPKQVEGLLEKYGQINGALRYVWELPDGTLYPVGNVPVSNGKVGALTFPDRAYEFIGEKEGHYTGVLKLTFEPDKVDTSTGNFADDTTKKAVSELTKPGNVYINVYDEKTSFWVKKKWAVEPPADTVITFKVLANGTPIQDEGGQDKEYTLSEANSWECEITDLPSFVNEEFQKYTVEEVVPLGYLPIYSDGIKEIPVYTVDATLKFKFTDKKRSDKKYRIFYSYLGEEKYVDTEKSTFEKNIFYSVEAKALPVDEDNNPYPCEITKIQEFANNGTDLAGVVATGDYSATVEMGNPYINDTTETYVKIITNVSAYALPHTGGIGARWFTLSGLIIILSAFVYIFHIRFRRERGTQ